MAPGEVLAAGPAGERGRRRRWPWVLFVLVVVVAVAWQPVAGQLARSEGRWLARSWALRTSYDNARHHALDRVSDLARATDVELVLDAVAAVDRQEAARLAELRRAIGARRLTSGDVRRVRRLVVAALEQQVDDLRAAAARRTPVRPFRPGGPFEFPPALTTSRAAVSLADRQVTALNTRLHLPAAEVAEPRLTAVDPTLAALTRPFPTPTGLAVLVVSAERAQLVDIDTGTTRTIFDAAAAGLTDTELHLVAVDRDVFTFATGSEVVFVPRGGGPPRRVAGAVVSPVPGGVWVSNGATAEAGEQLRLIDRTGRTRLGPVRLPPGAGLAGAFGSALLYAPGDVEMFGSARLWRWQPGQAPSPFLGPDTRLLNHGGSLVAWRSWRDARTVHLTDVTSGRDLATWTLPPQQTAAFALIAGDGRHVAVNSYRQAEADIAWWAVTSPGGLHPVLPGQSLVARAWSDDGRWLLLATWMGGPDSELWLCDTTTGSTKPLRLQLTGSAAALLPAHTAG